MHDNLEKPDCLIKHSDDLEELVHYLKGDVLPGDLLVITGSGYLDLDGLADRVCTFGAVSPAFES